MKQPHASSGVPAGPQRFGVLLLEGRRALGLTLRDAAQLLNISPSYLSRLENDSVPAPAAHVLTAISKLYRIPLSQLLEAAPNRLAPTAELGPAAFAFYRLAEGQPQSVQESMLQASLESLKSTLPPEQLEVLRTELERILSRMRGRDLPRRTSGDDSLFALSIPREYLSAEDIESLARQVLESFYGDAVDFIDPPVDIESLVENLDPDIHLVVEDIVSPRLPDGSPSVLGVSRWSRCGTRRELVIHSDLYEAPIGPARYRGNFTIAHELFHCWRHLPLVGMSAEGIALERHQSFEMGECIESDVPRTLFTDEDWREWQANRFAAALLMPKPALYRLTTMVIEQHYGNPDQPGIDSHTIVRLPLERPNKRTTCLAHAFGVNYKAMQYRLRSLGLFA